MKRKRRKKRKQPFRSFKRNRHNESVDCLLAGGAGMAADSDTESSINNMMMEILNSGGTISLIVDDGRLVLIDESSGMVLCDDLEKEVEQ